MSETQRAAGGSQGSDEALMARYAAGDAGAFEELFGRYQARAYAYFLKRTGCPERSEDLYQELFLRIHRARERYDASRPFTPWFFQIASRLLIDDRRRAFRSHEVRGNDSTTPADGRCSEGVVADREQIDQILGSLSPDECYVVISAKVEGVGYPELAEQLGKSVDAVKKMASRAIQRIRPALDPASRPEFGAS